MRAFGYFIAYGLVAGTIYRVSNLLADGLGMSWQGWAIGFGVAGGLAVSGKFISGHGLGAGITFGITFAICLAGDIWMNALEITRVLRPMDVGGYANYYKISALQLKAAVEITGIIISFMSSILGFLLLLGLSLSEKKEPGRLETWFAVQVAKLRSQDDSLLAGIARWQHKSEKLPKTAREKRAHARGRTAVAWEELSSKDMPIILRANRQAIMEAYGVSDGTAKNWKARFKAGETPWPQSPGIPVELPAEIDVEVEE